MADTPTPSKTRGDTLREVAAIIRGMNTTTAYSIDQLPLFFEDQAAANDILLAGRNDIINANQMTEPMTDTPTQEPQT